MLHLLFRKVGALELEHDPRRGKYPGCNDVPGHERNDFSHEDLAPHVPDVEVQATGEAEGQHNQVDGDLEWKHERCILPSPGDRGRTGPAEVQRIQLDASALNEGLARWRNPINHVANDQTDPCEGYGEHERSA